MVVDISLILSIKGYIVCKKIYIFFQHLLLNHPLAKYKACPLYILALCSRQ